ncbi:MAG: insulinase family protein [Candidatus Marinimicrobia bacterium]|nr:insulinase family protein [Candidatus Neomarinimicrobiota bacterium]MCF7828695.1 insulinase family protein [Candidatus Neomarinimicrobiota bacterium]MCF7880436.1 insulinase family protein [Candidatus Neomarinimicrobiota bacterium]
MLKKTTLGVLSLIFILSGVAFAQLDIEYEKYQLDNGLTVILYEDHSAPLVTVNIWYYVGSKNEKPGKTGFAHLFEHMMFQGSKNVGDDMHFQYIEEAGGTLNGSTSTDRTNYWEDLPNNYLELALWLESDRMGWLLPAMTQSKLDNQRNVVKNERRQNYENRPYGLAHEAIFKNLYPEGHPYHWMTIGSMEDLSNASLEDVKEFFRSYYHPANASLVVAGDFEPAEAKSLVKKYFGPIDAGPEVEPLNPGEADLSGEKRIVQEDQVQLPRLYMAFQTPAFFEPGDAAMDVLSSALTGGKNSRLYKTLVFEKRIAKDVNAAQWSRLLESQYMITATATPGHSLGELEDAIWAEIEKIQQEAITDREVEKAVNSYEASFIYQLQRVGGFGGVADRLQVFNFHQNEPGFFNKNLERYKEVTPEDVKAVANKFLKPDARVVLSVVPEGKLDLQASAE